MAKVTKADANYRKATVRGQNCHVCRFMHSDGTCAKVEGEVKPDHVCDLFEPPAKESLIEAFAAGWALVEDAPEPTDRHFADLIALEGLDVVEAMDAGERSARRATLERARLRAYRRESKKVAAALAALLLAHVDIDHLATVLVLMGTATLTKRNRADQAFAVLTGAMYASPQALKAWQDANHQAWAVAVARGQAEAEASTEVGPPLPRRVSTLARRNEADLADASAPDWTQDQLGRLAWDLSADDIWDHEDPAAVIKQRIESGDAVRASTEDLMHRSLARTFIDWVKRLFGIDDRLLAWVTEGDSRVCPECDELEANSPYDPDDAPEMPAHPLCRCHFERV